jgi:hypothetical protein
MATATITVPDNKISSLASALEDVETRPDGMGDGAFVKYAVKSWLNRVLHHKTIRDQKGPLQDQLNALDETSVEGIVS